MRRDGPPPTAMPRRNDTEVYKKGAYALLPLLAVGLFVMRSCLRASLQSDARDRANAIGDIEAEIDQQRRRERELAALEERARARAEAAPAPPGARSSPLAAGQPGPDAIAVDATHVYWINDASGELLRAPKAGGAPTVLATKQSVDAPRHAAALAVDESSVYWLTTGTREKHGADGAVMKLPKAGGEPVVLAGDQRRPAALVLSGAEVLWLRPKASDAPDDEEADGAAPADAGAAVMRVKKQGGKPAVVAAAEEPCALTAEKDWVYWVDQGDPPAVMRARRSGGKPEDFGASSARLGCAVAVDASSIYWINKNADAVMRASKAGDDPIVLGFGPTRLAALAMDERSVYAIAESTPGALDDSGNVWRMPKDGSSKAEAIAGDEAGLNGLAVDADGVYWTRWSEMHHEGAVVRLPK